MDEIQTSEPVVNIPQKRSWIKIGLIIVGVLVVLIVVGLFAYAKYQKSNSADIAPINDSDIREIQVINVPESDNAYFDLIKLPASDSADKLFEPAYLADFISFKSWDDNQQKEIYEKNKAFYPIYDSAASKSKYQNPLYTDPSKIDFDTKLPLVNTWRTMAKLNALQAIYLWKNKEYNSAIDTLYKTIKIADGIENSRSSTIEFLVGVAMKKTALETLQHFAQSPEPAKINWSAVSNKLLVYKNKKENVDRTIMVEYIVATNAIDQIASGKLSREYLDSEVDLTSYSFKPNLTKSYFIDHTRKQIEAGENCTQKYDPVLPDTSNILVENYIGKAFFSTLAVSLQGIYEKQCESDVLIASIQATAKK